MKLATSLLVAFILLAGCDRSPWKSPGADAAAGGAAAADRYESSKMDLKSAPAKVTGERNNGALASGSALSTDATLKPLDAAPVKELRLDTTHSVVTVAPGVNYIAWTFGGQVPGPTIRAKVGDRIKFIMTNRSDHVVPGLQVIDAPMMHSMDFHAAMVSPQDKYRSIAPGQTIEFEFRLNYPGVFMYHCGTPMTLEHIASGMYGALIAEPREGYPTKVDREYVIVQSEFYTKPDPGKRRLDGQTLHVLDAENLRKAMPSYTVFNGQHNGMVTKPLPAKPGERVRLYVLNVGPSRTSGFHVVGIIFDRVWIEGNPDNQMRGMQTVLLGSSNSAIVEFMIPEAGQYIMVDHHFANASQGAVGLIDATGTAAATPDLEHHNIPAVAATPSDPAAVKGQLEFQSKCLACHAIGGGKKLGPDLAGVTKRRTERWLAMWLKAPDVMLQSDPDAKQMLGEYNNLPMPNQHLGEAEIRQYIKYFKWVDAQPAGSVASGAAGH
jgi:nitrite reductase (NO-forming)